MNEERLQEVISNVRFLGLINCLLPHEVDAIAAAIVREFCVLPRYGECVTTLRLTHTNNQKTEHIQRVKHDWAARERRPDSPQFCVHCGQPRPQGVSE